MSTARAYDFKNPRTNTSPGSSSNWPASMRSMLAIGTRVARATSSRLIRRASLWRFRYCPTDSMTLLSRVGWLGLRGRGGTASALEGKTFSASVGALIKSNARLEISLGLLRAMHRREQTCASGVGFLQALAATVGGVQRLRKGGDRLLRVAEPFLGQTEAVMT